MKQVATKAVEMEAEKVSQLGGKSNYLFVMLNLLLSWLGWALILAALSAFQHYINKSNDAADFAVNANYPDLKVSWHWNCHPQVDMLHRTLWLKEEYGACRLSGCFALIGLYSS